MDFKRDEIIEYNKEVLDEYDDEDIYIFDDDGKIEWSELHNALFNVNYFITNFRDGCLWFDNVENYIEVQSFVQRFHLQNYGEIPFDITDPLKVINNYCYIIGEEELPKIWEERYKNEISEALDKKLSNNEPKLVDRIWIFFAWFYHQDD